MLSSYIDIKYDEKSVIYGMFTIQNFSSHHEKAVKVILSCENTEHLEGARRFCINFIKSHTRSAISGSFYLRENYLAKIRKSESLLNEALSDIYYILKNGIKEKYNFKIKRKQ
jgi:hypothetical protein